MSGLETCRACGVLFDLELVRDKAEQVVEWHRADASFSWLCARCTDELMGANNQDGLPAYLSRWWGDNKSAVLARDNYWGGED